MLGRGLTKLKSYTIGKHIKFIDSVKYYQQPLSKLASSANAEEKTRIKSLFLDYFAYEHPYYNKFWMTLLKEDMQFVLEHLASGKGCFPYEIVTGFNSLSTVPEDGDFWLIESFYSRLKDEDISQKEWEACKKLYKVLKTRNFSDFSNIYNIQDVIILAVILEYRWQMINDDTRFDPRCFTSASTLSSTIERIKSKAILTYPTNVETVDLMEKILSGRYSSVHTRLGFDTELFTPESEKYMKEKDRILEDIRNLKGNPNEKVKRKNLKKELCELFKQEDLNSSNKQIYTLRLDRESQSHYRRVF